MARAGKQEAGTAMEMERVKKHRERESEGEKAKIIFSLQLLVYHCSWPDYFLLTGEAATEKTTTWNKCFFN